MHHPLLLLETLVCSISDGSILRFFSVRFCFRNNTIKTLIKMAGSDVVRVRRRGACEESVSHRSGADFKRLVGRTRQAALHRDVETQSPLLNASVQCKADFGLCTIDSRRQKQQPLPRLRYWQY